jgi:hypothetical protein
VARPLPNHLCRRVTRRPGWVKSPRWITELPIHWSVDMTWTKPEAEVVAVTMEVTAYVATL